MSEPEEQQPDIHTTAGKLADLQRRIEEATHAGPHVPSKSSTPRAS
ncbi:hypothetical protein ACFQV4_34990 [Streptomyces thermocarboxydus]